MRNESNSGRTFLGHYPPATIPREKGLSVSIHVGTRKVSNTYTYMYIISFLFFISCSHLTNISLVYFSDSSPYYQ